MGNCNACPLYQAAEKFAATSCRRSPDREYNTEHGRVIAAECSRLGLSLAEVSVACGYSDDYLARVCRGSLPLVRSCAVRVGDKLGLALVVFVVASVRAARKGKGESAAPDLPGVSVPVAPGVSVAMGAGEQQGAS